MSYEGYVSYLCQRGHLHTRDAYVDPPAFCPDCDAPFEWERHTDETNGPIEDDPATHPAALEPNSWDDVWNTDHYGNRYATKLWKWKPADELWRRV